MQNAKTKQLLFPIIVLVELITMIFFSTASFATEGSTSITTSASVTIDTTCLMSATENIPHSAEIPAGTYRNDIGKTTIKTYCNDAGGYSIYAIGFTNNEPGRNDMLGNNTGRTIATGTATSGGNSNWAMKLTAVAGAYQPTINTDTAGSFASYHTVPNEYTKVASFSSDTDDGTIGSKIETTYATYAAGSQSPDTYNGKVKYTLVHPTTSPDVPCISDYTIAYNANTGSGNMDNQTACVGRSTALLPSGFTAPDANHNFAGWNTAADGSGTFYVAGQSVNDLAAPGETANLYAVWGPKYIQDLTAATCSKIASGVANTFYDRRDGSDYKVRYINDACWMVQNLRITGIVSSEYSNFDRVANFDVCEGDLTAGDDYNQARCHDSDNTANGVWYNYAAATAGDITGTNNHTVVTQDICPAGWHLPSHNSSGEAGSINSITGSVGAFSPVSGGHYYNGSLRDVTYGVWWSTPAPDGATGHTGRYILRYNDSSFTISSDFDRGRGGYIRCTR